MTAVILLLASALPVFGQGCALCYTQAANSGARMIQALRSGILILIVPPAFLYTAIAVMAYRRRNQFKDDAEQPESDFGITTGRHGER